MASPLKLQTTFFFLLSISLHGVLAEIICENLPKDLCTLSIASSGKRCLLENYVSKHGTTEYECRTSDVVVEKMAEYIESDECMKSCGIDRNMVGISSDSLVEPQTTAKICAPACYHNCPNVVDLYFNLAAGEGVFLPDLCKAQRANPRRAMLEVLKSGSAGAPSGSALYAGGPVGSSLYADSPLPSSSLYAEAPFAQDSFYADAPAPAYADSPRPSSSMYAEAPFADDDPFYADAPAPAYADSPRPSSSMYAEAPFADDDPFYADAPAPDSF